MIHFLTDEVIAVGPGVDVVPAQRGRATVLRLNADAYRRTFGAPSPSTPAPQRIDGPDVSGALVEMVGVLDLARGSLTPAMRDAIFDSENALANTLWSFETRQLVKRIRKTLETPVAGNQTPAPGAGVGEGSALVGVADAQQPGAVGEGRDGDRLEGAPGGDTGSPAGASGGVEPAGGGV